MNSSSPRGASEGRPGTSRHPHANLIETQCHGLDMLEFLCGPIASVMAQMTNKTQGSYTTLAVALEFANGAVGSMVGSYDSSYAYPLTHLVEVNGTAGRVLIEDTVKPFTISRAGVRGARGVGGGLLQRRRPRVRAHL